MSQDADANHRDPVGGFQPLHVATKAGSLSLACRLITAGADVVSLRFPFFVMMENYAFRRFPFISGQANSLFVVCRFFCCFLFCCCCCVFQNSQKNDGWTPLHLAVSNGHRLLVHLLLLQGASTRIQNVEKKTAKDLASAQVCVCFFFVSKEKYSNLLVLKKKPLYPQSLAWFTEIEKKDRTEQVAYLRELESMQSTVWPVGDDQPMRREVIVDDRLLSKTRLNHGDRFEHLFNSPRKNLRRIFWSFFVSSTFHNP
jgi:hypothetical protein